MHETSAQDWCTGKTQREMGGGPGWGTHVNPWLIHVNVWQKLLQYCKVISLQLIKIIGKKIIFKKHPRALLFVETPRIFFLIDKCQIATNCRIFLIKY